MPSPAALAMASFLKQPSNNKRSREEGPGQQESAKQQKGDDNMELDAGVSGEPPKAAATFQVPESTKPEGRPAEGKEGPLKPKEIFPPDANPTSKKITAKGAAAAAGKSAVDYSNMTSNPFSTPGTEAALNESKKALESLKLAHLEKAQSLEQAIAEMEEKRKQ